VCVFVCAQVQTEGTHRSSLPALPPLRLTLTFTSVSLSAADEQAFGCRADKLRGCKLQRSAWDGNAELLTPLFTAIRAPLPRERLTRGAPRGASYMQQRAAALRKRDQMKTITEEVEAQKLFEEAVVSGVARASREALAHGAGS
jgi:hypothetical protein